MAQELRSFVTKFESLMQAGTDALLECHAGQVRIKFEVNLNNHPPLLQPQFPPHLPSPSRLRRHARRAEARAHAAAGAPLTAEIAVQTEAPPANSEAVGNAAPILEPPCPPSTAEAAVHVIFLMPAVHAGRPAQGQKGQTQTFWELRGVTATILNKMLYRIQCFTIFCIVLTCFGGKCKENLFNLLSYKFCKPI